VKGRIDFHFRVFLQLEIMFRYGIGVTCNNMYILKAVNSKYHANNFERLEIPMSHEDMGQFAIGMLDQRHRNNLQVNRVC
jgi:hypothetical protein